MLTFAGADWPSPDPIRLAIPKAYVLLVSGVERSPETALSIFKHLHTRLAPFKRIRKTVPLKTLMDGVQAYALLNIGQDKSLIKLPAGWLNDERWEDEQIVNATKRTTTDQPRECQLHPGYPMPCDKCEREGRHF